MEMKEETIDLGHHHSEAFEEQARTVEAPVEHADETEHDTPEIKQESSPVSQDNVDDYGNEIPPSKMYTQAEVEAMMRDRNRRGEFAKQEQAPQQAQKFEYNPDDGSSWETQLETFNENWFTKREMRAKQEEIQRQEQETNANFEIRFNQGASKYQDFEQVVVGKPLTPQMVIATRGMQDPAAFIYAAAKTQAPELERISRLTDQMAQAVELGKLEERMRKSRASVSQAPKPIDMVKGDMSEKKERTWSIDDKLRQAEDASKKDRMRGRNI